jgi:hypothetical protein
MPLRNLVFENNKGQDNQILQGNILEHTHLRLPLTPQKKPQLWRDEKCYGHLMPMKTLWVQLFKTAMQWHILFHII